MVDYPSQHQAPSGEVLQLIIPNDTPPLLLFVLFYKARSICPFVRPQRLPMSFLSLLRHTNTHTRSFDVRGQGLRQWSERGVQAAQTML